MADFRTEYQKIYESIRNAVVAGDFVPGERLPQLKLARKFNTTTITVREALRFLEQDGLVVIEPKWGAMVIEITPDKVRGRYIVREALEGMAARLAAQNIDAAEKKQLVGLAAECDRELVGSRLGRQEKATLHYDLHRKIVSISRCPELIQSINRSNMQTVILSNAYHIVWHQDVPRRHSALIKSLNSGDADLAERTMREHVQAGCAMELEALENKI